jgi:hypothetical protein
VADLYFQRWLRGPLVVANGNELHDRPTLHDEHGARIGETPNRVARVEYPYDSPEGQAAVAHLLAAAPALYAALQQISVDVEHLHYLSGTWSAHAGRIQKLVADACRNAFPPELVPPVPKKTP